MDVVDRKPAWAAGMHAPIKYRDFPLGVKCGEEMECIKLSCT
jgi:hypothetical protein